jgi:hypothetical protein
MPETIITALLPIVVTLMLGFFAGWERSFDQAQALAAPTETASCPSEEA